MSILIVRLQNEEHLSLLKKFIGQLNEKAEIFSDEEYRDSFFSKLLEEGRKSKLLSSKESKRALKKHGITI